MKLTLNRSLPFRGLLSGITLIILALTLAGCSDKPQPASQPAPAKLLEQERGVLDKAKGVEQAITKGAEDLRQGEEKQVK